MEACCWDGKRGILSRRLLGTKNERVEETHNRGSYRSVLFSVYLSAVQLCCDDFVLTHR